jgi:hypothetical protein
METIMRTNRSRRHKALVWAAAPVLALGLLAGCSSSDETSTANPSTTAGSTGTTAPGTTSTTVDNEATVAFDKTIQQELKDVGCYTGNVDGILGPESDAAILAFQSASGLETDGELGPETESALATAVSKKETVCKAPTTTSTSTKPGTTTTTAASGGVAPCTATALAMASPEGSTINSFVCSGTYAAGTLTGKGASEPSPFLFESVNGAWSDPSQSPCGTASAGIPPIILETGCPKNP